MTEDIPAQQLPLDLSRRPGFSRDELVVTPANAAAVALVDRWPDWPSPVVVLAGPAGAGKSHIAEVWRQRSGALPVARGSIEAAAIEAASARPILIDGVDGPVDEAGLFHLINAVRAAGSNLLLTSRRFPAAWRIGLPDLVSRLRAATIVEIAEPDDLLLSAVMTKLFADRQIQVEPHVVSYIANRIERSLSTAMRVVDRLDAAALSRQTRISRSLAAEIVSSMDEGQGELDFDPEP